MRIHYRSDPDEGIQAITAAARTVTPSWAGLPTLAATLVVVGAFSRLTTHHWGETVGFTLIAFSGLHLFGKLEQRLRRTRAIETDPHSDESHEFEATERGLAFSCDHARSELTWSGVRRVQETPAHYLFVCGPLGACAVPKRAIPEVDDEALRTLIRTHSPDRGANLAREIGTAAPAT